MMTATAPSQEDAREANVKAWAAQQAWPAEEADCVLALMLKILDGKCKMSARDKTSAIHLYDALLAHPEGFPDRNDGPLTGERPSLHRLIAESRHHRNEAQCLAIYEQRILAETRISRPVMKAFKARLRAAGLLGQEPLPED